MKYDPDVENRYGIKLADRHTIRKESRYGTRQEFLFIQAAVNHFIRHPDPMVVPIYSFEVLESKGEGRDGQFGIFRYAYEMQRLSMLDDNERQIIDESSHHWKTGVSRDTDNHTLLSGWKNYPTLLEFINVVFQQKRYTDVHSGNILKDEDGNYRLIDLEGFQNYPLDKPENDWITRE